MSEKIMTGEMAELKVGGKVYQLPVIEGSEGEKAIDIRGLRAESGLVTLDSGFMNTGSCTSDITFLDGEKSILNYRGYSIEDLAENCSFVEVAYLLINGSLPDTDELEAVKYRLNIHSMLHEDMVHFFDRFPTSASPMQSGSRRRRES